MAKHFLTRGIILTFIFFAAWALAQGAVVFFVNDQAVTETEFERVKNQNQLFALPAKGFIKTDFDNLLMNQLVLVSAARQDALNVELFEDDVDNYINDLRKQRDLNQDADYASFLESVGYTEDSFREAVTQQLQLTKRIEEVQKSEEVSEEELKLYFDLYQKNYAISNKIVARQIVVANLKSAQQILTQLKAGADFAKLAREKSILNKDQDGALGAKPGETKPQPILELALPRPISEAAFKLKNGGFTSIIAYDDRFYILKIEQFMASRIPNFEQAIAELEADGETNKLRADAQALKANGSIEAWVKDLLVQSVVRVPEGSSLELYDPVVARVEDTDILLSNLNRAVYSNQQIQALLRQPGSAGLVRDFFKPQSLNDLINQSVAVQAAQELGLPFIGAQFDMTEAVKLYQTQQVKITEAEAKTYYQNNIAAYAIPASADLSSVNFRNQKAAEQFRAALKKPRESLAKLAVRFKGTLYELGMIKANAAVIPPVAQKAIFKTRLGVSKLGSYTTAIKLGSSYLVYLVNHFKPEQRRSFKEVKTVVTTKALEVKQKQAADHWLKEARKNFKIENFLDAVTKESETLGNRKP